MDGPITARIPRSRVDKFAERRAVLGEAALQTLGELGYAKTSLREIAQNSAFSHGVLHYYFQDKVDLILCSVRQYKRRCVTRYDTLVETAPNADALLDGFALALGDSARADAPMHRLWYDLRAQALFEPAFRADVRELDEGLEAMIWRVVRRLGELAGSTPLVVPAVAYATIDGLFQQCLLRDACGDEDAMPTLRRQVRQSMETWIGVPATVERRTSPRAAP